jgi:vinculin
VAERSLPHDAEHIRKLSGDIDAMAESLKELRENGQGATPQAEALGQSVNCREEQYIFTLLPTF